MSCKYWEIFAEEVPSDIGIIMTDEQRRQLTEALEGAHENYGLFTGKDVWDANWKANNERELIEKGRNHALKFIEQRLEKLETNGRIFDVLSHEQRLVMHELFQARNFLRKEAA